MREWAHRGFGPVWTGLLAALLLLQTGCSSTPDLSTRVRPGFDLTGNWELDRSRSDATPDTRRVVDEMDREMLRREGGFNIRREIADSAVFAFIAQDFPVLRANTLSIEQQADSMGIRYEPGGYRDVTWGERTRGLWTVSAGWDDDGSFVIHSDSDDIQALERHRLQDASTLQVLLRVRADGGDLDVVRTFTRTR